MKSRGSNCRKLRDLDCPTKGCEMMLESDTNPDIVSALIMNALRIDDEHRLMVVKS